MTETIIATIISHQTPTTIRKIKHIRKILGIHTEVHPLPEIKVKHSLCLTTKCLSHAQNVRSGGIMPTIAKAQVKMGPLAENTLLCIVLTVKNGHGMAERTGIAQQTKASTTSKIPKPQRLNEIRMRHPAIKV